jgi:hypothetical protein
VERSALARTYTEPAVELSKVPTVMAIYGWGMECILT